MAEGVAGENQKGEGDMRLSAKALSICRKNYKTNCWGCPLRSVCCDHIGPGKEAHDLNLQGRWSHEN